MEIMEVILLVVGGILFVASFVLPEKKEKPTAQTREMAKKEISEVISAEMEKVKGHVDDVVEEAVGYAMEKTERSLERISNEKIMAVNEYSDTVLAEIHKNHEEAMFLYDMLNSKHTNIKNTVSEVNRTMKEAEEKVTVIQTKIAEEQQAEDAVLEQPQQRVSEPNWIEDSENLCENEADNSKKNNNELILELYGQGKNNVEIARELNLGVGEVKLVIDLFCHR